MTSSIIEFLESIQLDCLKDRYGSNYQKEIKKLTAFNSKLMPDSLTGKFKSYYNLTDSELKEMEDFAVNQTQAITVLNTNYSLLSQNLILDFLFKRINNTVVKLKYSVKDVPYSGTAVSGEYNAFACEHPITHEKLIVFESELILLAVLFCKVITHSVPLEIKEDSVGFSVDLIKLEEHLNRNNDIIERFIELFHNTIFKGHPSETRQYFIQPTHQKLYYELLNSFELFIIGHEYGHVIAGHLNNKTYIKKISGVNLNIIETNWKEEYEADSIGLNLLLNSLDNTNLSPFCYLGPEIFFIFIDLVHRISSYLDCNYEVSDQGSVSHPPAIDRKKAIQEYLKNALSPDDYKAYKMFSDFVNSIAEMLWSKSKTSFSNPH